MLTTDYETTVCCIFQGHFRVNEKPQDRAIISFYFFLCFFKIYFWLLIPFIWFIMYQNVILGMLYPPENLQYKLQNTIITALAKNK